MTKQEISKQVEAKFGKAEGIFLVNATGVWLEDGIIEIDSVDAGFQSMFFKGVNVDVEIPIIKAETDEGAEAMLEAKLKEIFPEAESILTTIQ